MPKTDKLKKSKNLLNRLVYSLFGTGVAYAGWQFLTTPRTTDYIEWRRLYAIEAWILFGLLAIYILVNLHLHIEKSHRK